MSEILDEQVREVAARICKEREELRDLAHELGNRLRSKIKNDMDSTPADRAILLQLDMVMARVYRTDFGI